MTQPTQLPHIKKSKIFQTELGWMGLVTSANTICKLAFGYETIDAARAQIDPDIDVNGSGQPAAGATGDYAWIEELVQRLQDYSSGRPVEFDDFQIDTRAMTDFGRGVILACRKIPYGQTLTYGQLAARAGNSGAARAVGNQMANNRIPLIVPCHRVLRAGKGLGGYSAAGGVEMKRRLLEMEAGR